MPHLDTPCPPQLVIFNHCALAYWWARNGLQGLLLGALIFGDYIFKAFGQWRPRLGQDRASTLNTNWALAGTTQWLPQTGRICTLPTANACTHPLCS